MIAKLKNFIKDRNEKGFTLIEIVLVMAIAGLIFVIVFLAVSQAQQARRDTQRSTDLSRMAAQLEQFASNNNGNYPDEGTGQGYFNGSDGFAGVYLPSDEYQDPLSGTVYGTSSAPPANVEASFTVKGPDPKLNGPEESGPDAAAEVGYQQLNNGRGYRICMGLEAGVRCQDTD